MIVVKSGAWAAGICKSFFAPSAIRGIWLPRPFYFAFNRRIVTELAGNICRKLGETFSIV